MQSSTLRLRIVQPINVITHMYIVDSADVGRFNTLGVVIDFRLNPGSLDTSDYIPFLKEVLGTTRADRLLSVKTLLDSGANVVLSSDYDAGPLSPLGTIKRALTRPDNLAQRVSDSATAIEMVTINVAHHFHQEAKTGSLNVENMQILLFYIIILQLYLQVI